MQRINLNFRSTKKHKILINLLKRYKNWFALSSSSRWDEVFSILGIISSLNHNFNLSIYLIVIPNGEKIFIIEVPWYVIVLHFLSLWIIYSCWESVDKVESEIGFIKLGFEFEEFDLGNRNKWNIFKYYGY